MRLAAAGDIAADRAQAAATARLLASMHPDYVLALGDNAYPRGSERDYRKYDATWGAFKALTKPVPGNHEYETLHAAGYFAYFAGQVGARPYYAWDAGSWRLYALNCEVGCAASSAEERWLRADLAAHLGRPVLAYVHRPRYTCSTAHPPDEDLDAVWDDLTGHGGRIMLAGHNHAYERFTPQDAHGQATPLGLRQFVVGTGGADLYHLEPSCPGREAADDTTRGVLELTLGTRGYAWRFLSINGQVLDAGEQEIA